MKNSIIKKIDRKKQSQRGISVVELLATVFIFSVMALVISSVFIKAMEVERRVFASQAIQENAMAVLELMAKEIRVSNISNLDTNCIATTLTINHPTITSGSPGNITYQLSGGMVQKIANGITYFLSSDEVVFNDLRFCVLGSSQPSDNLATRVAILASISNRTGRDILTVKLQTSVVTRDLTTEFQY